MTEKQNKMFPKEINNFTFIMRIKKLEGIIFDLKETLKFYADDKTYREIIHINSSFVPAIQADDGEKARKILEKYNKNWDEIYKDVDKEIDKLDKNE